MVQGQKKKNNSVDKLDHTTVSHGVSMNTSGLTVVVVHHLARMAFEEG